MVKGKDYPFGAKHTDERRRADGRDGRRPQGARSGLGSMGRE